MNDACACPTCRPRRAEPPFSAHIFCRVIDNFGDAGVCWRLARRLDALGLSVRLVIDRPDVLHRLVPEADPRSGGTVAGIEVTPWDSVEREADAGAYAPADLTVETFGCRLPDAVEKALEAARIRRRALGEPEDGSGTLYVNLDYLSAEDWVETCHNVRGMHPTLDLPKLWFFPGFTDATGGVLIEDAYEADEAAFAVRRNGFLESLGADPDRPTLFFFAYPVNALAALADALRRLPEPVNLLAAPGEAGDRIARLLADVPNVRVVRPGFLPQERFDELLWASDLLMIRGEDSFVRAQLAGKTLLWSTYPTEDGAHLVKMDAWLARYLPVARAVSAEAAEAFEAFNRTWLAASVAPGDLRRQEAFTEAFLGVWPHREALREAAVRWRRSLFARGDLARHLLDRAVAPV